MVEKKVTEAVFDKIWRHYSAEDEARDDALRSKTMALGVVGIGLKELGLEEDVNVMDLQPVCETLKDLNSSRCPYDKLKSLKRAHKAIVVPSTTSSADHILPILIYALIISPPHISIISNLLYIQRFRYYKAVDGEAAYCLTNLEAAISFLETVDMGTLTTEEQRHKMSGIETNNLVPSHSLADPAGTNNITPNPPTSALASAIVSTSSANASPRLSPGPLKGQALLTTASESSRRISYLTPVEFATSAATSAVNTADQSLKTIGNSLENSYKFLFGKLSDKRTELPKTLEDVRKLVGTPSQGGEPINDEDIHHEKANPDLVAVMTSTASLRNNDGSHDNKIFADDPLQHIVSSAASLLTQEPTEPQPNHIGSAYTPVADSVRNLGNQLGRFAGNINVIRTFSRSQMTKTPPLPGAAAMEVDHANSSNLKPSRDPATIDPPIQRFLETNGMDLKIGDIQLLVQDYQRLAAALRKLGAF
ncbi:hypothetical protein AA313_de0208950 [Arthrobotrys entomopaga]|nr:hypothetical protein AA313_de0208950 [Arthrobotrys entomopaga]